MSSEACWLREHIAVARQQIHATLTGMSRIRTAYLPALLLTSFFIACAVLNAQEPKAQNTTDLANMPAPAADLAALVEKQFGPDFQIVTESPSAKIVGAALLDRTPAKWKPLFTADLDGDGVEDAIIIARNNNANIGAAAYGYRVFDAYNDHFGYGNPQVTASFNGNDPIHNMVMLVIHGSGPQAWRSDKPKAKYVLINVPFEQVSISRTMFKKRAIDAIRVEESDTISSVLFFDGKKYRYIPGGGEN